jgi:hypothetical protein
MTSSTGSFKLALLQITVHWEEPICRSGASWNVTIGPRHHALSMGAMLSAARSPRAHVEDVEHRLPNPTARSVAEATETDVTRTPHSAHEDL